MKQALRKLYRDPIFSLVTILSLAVGFGTNNSAYAVLESCTHPAFGYERMSQMLRIRTMTVDGQQGDLSQGEFETLRERVKSLEGVAISSYPFALNVLGQSQLPERVTGLRVDKNFFRFLGIALRGTGFNDDDANTVVITYDFWQQRFNGTADIMNKYVNLNGVDYKIKGVLPAGFRWLSYRTASVFVPLTFQPETNSKTFWRRNYVVVGRLRESASLVSAQAEVRTMFAGLNRDNVSQKGTADVRLVPLVEDTAGFLLPRLVLLQIAVGCILLISCSNVANLLIAKSFSRTKEFALRQALGATRWIIMRQLFLEGLLLSLIASAIGLVLSFWGGRLLEPILGNIVPYSGMSARVMGFSLLVLFGATIIFSIFPGVFVLRTIKKEHLGEGGQRMTLGRQTNRVRQLLVVVQLGLSVVLMIGAELMVQSLLNRLRIQVHFNPNNILVARIPLLDSRYQVEQTRIAFVDQLLTRVKALPGAESAAAVSWIPLRGSDSVSFEIPGSSSSSTEPNQQKANMRMATSDFFRTLQVRIVAGRDFTAADLNAGRNLAIISHAMATKYWPGRDPVGSYIKTSDATNGDKLWEIVGIVDDIPDSTIYDVAQSSPQMYFLSQAPSVSPWLLIRTHSNPSAIVPSLRKVIAEIDSNQPLAGGDALTTMQAQVARDTEIPWILMKIFLALTVLAALMASLGVYGMASFVTEQRRPEIGIRMALGASRSDIFRFILFPAGALTILSLLFGLTGFLLLRKLIANFVYGISAGNTLIIVTALAGVAIIALVASYFPARRAAHFDPLESLRA